MKKSENTDLKKLKSENALLFLIYKFSFSDITVTVTHILRQEKEAFLENNWNVNQIQDKFLKYPVLSVENPKLCSSVRGREKKEI